MRALVLLASFIVMATTGCGRTVLPKWIHKPPIVLCCGDCRWVPSGGYSTVCVCPEDKAPHPCSSAPESGSLCRDQGDRPEMWDHCWYCKDNKKWEWLDRPEPEEEE